MCERNHTSLIEGNFTPSRDRCSTGTGRWQDAAYPDAVDGNAAACVCVWLCQFLPRVPASARLVSFLKCSARRFSFEPGLASVLVSVRSYSSCGRVGRPHARADVIEVRCFGSAQGTSKFVWAHLWKEPVARPADRC